MKIQSLPKEVQINIFNPHIEILTGAIQPDMQLGDLISTSIISVDYLFGGKVTAIVQTTATIRLTGSKSNAPVIRKGSEMNFPGLR